MIAAAVRQRPIRRSSRAVRLRSDIASPESRLRIILPAGVAKIPHPKNKSRPVGGLGVSWRFPPKAPCQRISIHLPDVVAYGAGAGARPDGRGRYRLLVEAVTDYAIWGLILIVSHNLGLRVGAEQPPEAFT
jgi:hypothetical protein